VDHIFHQHFLSSCSPLPKVVGLTEAGPSPMFAAAEHVISFILGPFFAESTSSFLVGVPLACTDRQRLGYYNTQRVRFSRPILVFPLGAFSVQAPFLFYFCTELPQSIAIEIFT
jgi:hypothetical protein